MGVDPLLTLAVMTPIGLVIVMVRLANARIGRFRQTAQQSIGNVKESVERMRLDVLVGGHSLTFDAARSIRWRR